MVSHKNQTRIEYGILLAVGLVVIALMASGCNESLKSITFPSNEDHVEVAVEGVDLEARGIQTLARIEMENTTDPEVRARQAEHLNIFTQQAAETRAKIEGRKPSYVRIIEPYLPTDADGNTKLSPLEMILGALGIGGGSYYVGGRLTATAKGKK